MTKEIVHSIILIITITLAFIFPQTTLAQYDLQIAALLFIVLFIGKKIISLVRTEVGSRLLESVIFTLIILIIINSTGSVTSPFFFLIYFLLFSLALLLEPIISITMTLTLIIFFLLSLPSDQNFKNLLPIFSLAFLTPFALFMGQEFIRNENLKMKNEKLQKDTFLFLSLMLKNHLKNIETSIENFMGDHQLGEIKKQVRNMKKLIDGFEKTN